jgi:hypothetical protein
MTLKSQDFSAVSLVARSSSPVTFVYLDLTLGARPTEDESATFHRVK